MQSAHVPRVYWIILYNLRRSSQVILNIIHARIHDFVSLSRAGKEGSIEGIPVGRGPPARFYFSASPTPEALCIGALGAPSARIGPPWTCGSSHLGDPGRNVLSAGKDPLHREPDLCAQHGVISCGELLLQLPRRRAFAIIGNSNVERRYSGDIAGPKTGNSFASRMAPSISLRRHTTNPHFSPRSRPASRGTRAERTMRPGVRSARSGSKSVAGTTVEAHIVRSRARGRATRLRAFPSSLGRTASRRP